LLPLSTSEPAAGALFVLAATVLLLFLLAVAFAVLVLALRLRNAREARRLGRLEERWKPLLLEVFANEASVADLLASVAPGEQIHFTELVLRYWRQLRGRERLALGELARPHLSLFAARARHRREHQRARAVQVLGTLGLPHYEGEVLAALDDPSPLVAMVAARSLTRTGRLEYLDPVLGRLARFAGWRRTYLAGMLARTGSDAAPALRAVLANPEQELAVRVVAADALLQLSDPASAEVAAEIARTESNRDLLVSCLRLLGKVGTGIHRSAALGLVASPEFAVRSQAMRALGVLGRPEDQPILEEGLEDPSPWVALEAARGLGALGETGTLQALARGDGPRASLAREVLAG